MKMGFGLYYHMVLQDDYLAFAKQCGASHVVVHLTDYFNQSIQNSNNQPVGNKDGWGLAGSNPHVWEYEYLEELKQRLAKHDLVLEAIENFDPINWYAVLLDLPEKEEQIERLQQIIRNVGRAGIRIFGYNFSLAGVSSRRMEALARGGAESIVMDSIDDRPISKGMIWNMIYNPQELGTGMHPSINSETLWLRLEWFLHKLLPVAEESGVRLAAHPDDPPVERVRQQPRLVNRPRLYQRLLDIQKSPSNVLEFCLGTLQEMPDMSDETGKKRDLLYWVEQYAEQEAIAYVHFRNVQGKAPHYIESFIDDGDINMKKVVDILRKHNFKGMLIPDHTPQMSSNAPWHTGMAYAMGYMKALIQDNE